MGSKLLTKKEVCGERVLLQENSNILKDTFMKVQNGWGTFLKYYHGAKLLLEDEKKSLYVGKQFPNNERH